MKVGQSNYHLITLTYFENFPVRQHFPTTGVLVVHILFHQSIMLDQSFTLGRLKLRSIVAEKEGGCAVLIRLLCAQTESSTWRVHIFVKRIQLSFLVFKESENYVSLYRISAFQSGHYDRVKRSAKKREMTNPFHAVLPCILEQTPCKAAYHLNLTRICIADI